MCLKYLGIIAPTGRIRPQLIIANIPWFFFFWPIPLDESDAEADEPVKDKVTVFVQWENNFLTTTGCTISSLNNDYGTQAYNYK